MNKDLFDQAIGEVPPSTVDVDAAIARERRAAWVRRAANPWVATAAGVVAVTFGVAVAMMPGSPDPVVGGIAPTSPTTPPSSTAPGPSKSPCVGMTPTAPAAPEQPAVAAERLTGVLTAAVQRQLAPGAQLLPKPATQNPPRPEYPPLKFVHESSPLIEKDGGCQGGSDEFLAGAKVVWSGQTGSIEAVVARLGGHASPSDKCDNQGTTVGFDVTCNPRTGPKGEVIIVTTLTPQGPGSTVRQVDVTKTDGTGIILLAADSADPKRADQPTSSAPPLTHEQLIAIALDAGMTLYPR